MPYKENKNLKLYYSISEVADMFHVSETLLRYWEREFPTFITPRKSGRQIRQYTEENIEQVRLVYHLVKEKGMTLQGARQTLKNNKTGTVQTMEIDDLQQYDAQQSMDLYLESGVDYAYEGTEEINGMTTDKYSGVIRGDAMEEVMKASGATSNLESSLGGSVDLSDLYSDMGDMPITVWIDQETGYPVRYYMDMTDVMQAMMTKMFSSMGAGSITIGKMQITMDCFNFDNVADFEIPAEALAA